MSWPFMAGCSYKLPVSSEVCSPGKCENWDQYTYVKWDVLIKSLKTIMKRLWNTLFFTEYRKNKIWRGKNIGFYDFYDKKKMLWHFMPNFENVMIF